LDEFHLLVNVDESEQRGDRIASFLTRLSPTSSLDVGCSTGFLVRSLRKNGVEAFGLDVNGGEFLEDVGEYLSVVDAGRDRFPFSDNQFDLVTAITSLDYTKNYPHALDEICRVLRKEGKLLLTFATDPRYKFMARPNVFRKEVWIQELTKREFSFDQKLAREWNWEMGVKPATENSPIQHVPKSLLMLWRRLRGTSFGCVVATRK
jgi:ubiquinone/menaquinone biosynthesis C-methylase UbiE